jgi:hypothetical protein
MSQTTLNLPAAGFPIAELSGASSSLSGASSDQPPVKPQLANLAEWAAILARAIPVVGDTLRHQRVAILGRYATASLVEYLGSCGLGWLDLVMTNYDRQFYRPLDQPQSQQSSEQPGLSSGQLVNALNIIGDAARQLTLLPQRLGLPLIGRLLANSLELNTVTSQAVITNPVVVTSPPVDLPADYAPSQTTSLNLETPPAIALLLATGQAAEYAELQTLVNQHQCPGIFYYLTVNTVGWLALILPNENLFCPATLFSSCPTTITAPYFLAQQHLTNLVANFAKTLLLQHSAYARPELSYLLAQSERFFLVTHPSWPWSVQPVTPSKLATIIAVTKVAKAIETTKTSEVNEVAEITETVEIAKTINNIGIDNAGIDNAEIDNTGSLEAPATNSLSNNKILLPRPQPSSRQSSIAQRSDPRPLAAETYIIIGLGSLGSFAARLLYQLGANLVLVDDKLVSAANPIRQIYSQSQVGQSKAYSCLASLLSESQAISQPVKFASFEQSNNSNNSNNSNQPNNLNNLNNLNKLNNSNHFSDFNHSNSFNCPNNPDSSNDYNVPSLIKPQPISTHLSTGKLRGWRVPLSTVSPSANTSANTKLETVDLDLTTADWSEVAAPLYAYNWAVGEDADSFAQLAALIGGHQVSKVLLATGTATDRVISEKLRQLQMPHVVVSCYARAQYFEAILALPQKPCFSCLRGHLHLGPSPALTPEELARYAGNSQDLAAEPATVIETARAALLAVQLLYSLSYLSDTPWLQRALAQETIFFLGGNTCQPQGEDWVYHLPWPGNVQVWGVGDITGRGAYLICRACGRQLPVDHPYQRDLVTIGEDFAAAALLASGN